MGDTAETCRQEAQGKGSKFRSTDTEEWLFLESALLSQITGTGLEAAAYELTTLKCIPGTIHNNKTKIQYLDLPGIIEGAVQGKGPGRQVSIHLLFPPPSFNSRLLPLMLTVSL